MALRCVVLSAVVVGLAAAAPIPGGHHVEIVDADDPPASDRWHMIGDDDDTVSLAVRDIGRGNVRSLEKQDMIAGPVPAVTAGPHVLKDVPERLYSPEHPARIGAVFVVYVTWQGYKPDMSLEMVKDILFGNAAEGLLGNVAEALYFNSWGASPLGVDNVTYVQVEADSDPRAWSSLSEVTEAITREHAFQLAVDTTDHPPKRVIVISPGNDEALGNVGPFLMQTTFSWVRGKYIHWMSMMHELGHNFGLGHAGGGPSSNGYIRVLHRLKQLCEPHKAEQPEHRACTNAKRWAHDNGYQKYQDDAVMGYSRVTQNRMPDMTSIARYKLGWIPDRAVASYPGCNSAVIHPLNKGHKREGGTAPVLVFTVKCPFCPSHERVGVTGGHLYVSLRQADPNAKYGVSDNRGSTPVYDISGVGGALVLKNRVHVHFQREGGIATEMWTTLNAGEEYKVPGSTDSEGLYIRVCGADLDELGNAHVAVGSAPLAAGCDGTVAATSALAGDDEASSAPAVAESSDSSEDAHTTKADEGLCATYEANGALTKYCTQYSRVRADCPAACRRYLSDTVAPEPVRSKEHKLKHRRKKHSLKKSSAHALLQPQ